MTPKLLFAGALPLILVLVSSYGYRHQKLSNANNIEENLVRINDSLFVSRYEASNKEYNVFLEYLSQIDPALFLKCRVDSSNWLKLVDNGKPITAVYHRHAVYQDYPVVNISYEAVKEYCKWLNNQYNKNVNRKFKQVEFFLPTEELWIAVANGGDKRKIYPWGSHYLKDRQGSFRCNFKVIGEENITSDDGRKSYRVVYGRYGSLNNGSVHTVSVNSFLPSKPYGIHNMSGNVAEMVEEQGIAKGGGFNSTGYDVRIQSKMEYKNSSPEIGFRIFMKVLVP